MKVDRLRVGLVAMLARNATQLLSQYVTTDAYEFNDENAPDLFGIEVQ